MSARRPARLSNGMNVAVACAAAVALVALVPSGAMAQAPRVRTDLDTTLVSVGDRLQLTVTVEHAPGAAVVWPDSLSLEPFEVLGAELLAPRNVEGRVVTGALLTLTVFELGDLEVPSFDFRVEGPDGSSTVVSTDAFGVTVQSVGLDEGGDIRAIRGPLGIPMSVIYLLPWLFLLVLLGLAAFWLWRRLRREDDSSPRRSVIIPRLPHEEAYDALDRLEASDLLQRAEIKQYHIRVSEIIRTYVEGRFDVFALEMTTGEVMEGLREAGLDDEVLVAFDEFLRGCDLVKFAKHRPPPEACRQAMAAARELVDRTRGRVEDLADPPVPAAGGSPDGDGSSDRDGSHDGDGSSDRDGSHDENGGPDAGGSGSPDDPDDPRGSGASILETAGAEGA